jgi:LAS superfamily LD-carboxypeptidase LdcB
VLLDFDSLSGEQLISAILSWSALPGASRHHWGTDIDIIDIAAIPPGYQVKLIPEEYRQGGVFHRLDCWLKEHADRFGFFKPYRKFQGGVCEEPWHLSYAPVSKELLRHLKIDMVAEAITNSAILGKEIILEILPNLFRTYVLNVCD